MTHPNLILASESKTRKELLQNAGLTFEAVPSPLAERVAEEAFLISGGSLEDVALHLAHQKARAVSELYPDAYVIGADLTVFLPEGDGLLIHKAKNREEAVTVLEQLSGRTHILICGTAVYKNREPIWSYEGEVKVTMRDLTPEDIHHYLDRTGERVYAAAGCYFYSGLGIQLITSTDGSYFDILGLPLPELVNFLRTVGIHAW